MIREKSIDPSQFRHALRAGFVACLLSGSALAQVAAPTTAPASSSATDQSGAGLQEVIVTAQRRNEHLQDVPISISAFSGPALEKQEIHSLQDLSARVPGFVSTGTVGYGVGDAEHTRRRRIEWRRQFLRGRAGRNLYRRRLCRTA